MGEGAGVLEVDGQRIAYTLRRSARARGIYATIELRKGLTVVVPEAQPLDAVGPFLRARRRWIVRTLARFERLAARIPERPLVQGASLPWLGATLRLDVHPGRTSAARLGDALMVRVPSERPATIRRALTAWYRREAALELEARARAAAARHGLAVRSVRVGDQKTRWGSCSADGRLFLNWRLVLGPEHVADYLIAHELAHLRVRNHSREFWSEVGKICPTWKDQERWLRRYGVGLNL